MSDELKIEAVVQWGANEAYVLNRPLENIYTKVGHYVFAEDFPFYRCLYHEEPHGRFKAFSGARFNLKMDDGSVLECNGQYWHGGSQGISEILNLKLIEAATTSLEYAKRSLGFTAMFADEPGLIHLRSQYKGPVYRPEDYRKILRHDQLWERVKVLERDKKSLIKEARKNKMERTAR